MKYYINKKLMLSYDDALVKVTNVLKEVGFGIITEIDMHEKFKEKLNIDFRRYKIFGACSPKFAYETLQVEDKIGVFLPCNVIIQEWEEGVVEVAIINPLIMVTGMETDELIGIAMEVKDKLEIALGML